MEISNWIKTLLVNIAVIVASFERACKISVVIYFISLPFVDWKFYKIFLWVFILIVLQIVVLFKMNYKNIQTEVTEQMDKDLNDKKQV